MQMAQLKLLDCSGLDRSRQAVEGPESLANYHSLADR